MTIEPITQPHRWLLTPLRVPKRETLDRTTLQREWQLIAHLIWSHVKCKHTAVNPKHCIKCIWYWMTAEYCSEKCTMRQLSTLFKMQSVDIVVYEGHLPILHASLLIWAGNWKRQRRTRKQKKRQIQETVYPFHFRVQTTYWYKNRQTTNLGAK